MKKKEKKNLIENNFLFKTDINNKNSIERKRNYGIDIFKILATVNIVILHINLHSGLIRIDSGSSIFGKIWLLEIFAYWGVNGFGLISGFVGYKKYKYSNLIYIWIEVFFYSILLSIILFIIKEISYKEVFYSFFPILIKRHWYVNP